MEALGEGLRLFHLYEPPQQKKSAALEDFVMQSMSEQQRGPRADESLRPMKRRKAHEHDSFEADEAPLLASLASDPARSPGPTHLSSHLRAFMEEGDWDVCTIEWPSHGGQDGPSRSTRSPPLTSKVRLTSASGWKQVEEVCMDEGCL
eukprot:6000507-Amphidinium_carterae.1